MHPKVLCVIGGDADRPTAAMCVGLHRAGVELTAALSPAASARETLAQAGVRVLELDATRRLRLADIRALRREIRDGAYDIVHAFSGRALQSVLFATRHLSVRIVAYRGTMGNVSCLDPSSWVRFLHPRVDRIVCVSDAVRGFFLGMRPAFLRVPAERLVTIHKGHDPAWYGAEPADRRALGLPDDAFVVACVANYRPHKGIEWLVRAMGELPAGREIHLLLIGHLEAPALDAEIAASPAAARIHRTGYRADAASLVAASDAFVMPSTRREGLPRSVIEAMACSVAPIVSACGGNPELVAHGVTGLVVPVEDAGAIARAITALHDDPELRARYGRAARERIRTQFSIEATVRKTHELYLGLVAASGGRDGARAAASERDPEPADR